MDYYRPLGNPNSFIKALVILFSRARDEDVSPQEYLELAKDLEKQASRNAKDMELCERDKKRNGNSSLLSEISRIKSPARYDRFWRSVLFDLAAF